MAEEQEYGDKLLKLQRKKEQEIKKIYYDAIVELAALASNLPYRKTVFNLSLYPLLQRRVEYVLRSIAHNLEVAIVNGIDGAWQLSDEKNRVFLDRKLKGYKINQKVRKTYYDSNLRARELFKNRLSKGLKLSDRIWNGVKPFKNYLEVGLGEGIAKGESADKMATRLKRNLLEPERIYRRVRSEQGNPESPLRLSKRALNFKPGQGVYRSAYKNSLRLTRTETNMSYRYSDHDRWMTQPFVVGVEIRLSNAHPRFDICDPLAGKYPKNFKWAGWHPQCICYIVPILITPEEMEKYEDQLFGLGKWDGKSVNQVKDAPRAFYRYLDENADKIARRKSLPYWVQDNPEFSKSLK